MTTGNAGAMVIWHDVAAEADEDALNEWYNREHHPERVGVPGFLRARRHVALKGLPRYFTRYDTESPAVLTSRAYLERLDNPTAWTRRTLPHFRNMSRTVCRVTARLGRGDGGAVATLRLAPEEGAADDLRAWLIDEALPAAVERIGVCSASLLEIDREATGAPSEEKRMRGGEDETVDAVVLLSGNHPGQVENAAAPLLGDAGIGVHGAAPGWRFGVYRLIFDLVG